MSERQFRTPYTTLDNYDDRDGLLEADTRQSQLSSSQESRRSGPSMRQHTVGARTQRWRHVPDLYMFFSRIYQLHQSGGFKVLAVTYVGKLVFNLFVIAVMASFAFVDYAKLTSGDLIVTSNATSSIDGKIHVHAIDFSACVYTWDEAMQMGWFLWLLIWSALIVVVGQVLYSLKEGYHQWEMSVFFEQGLNIKECEMADKTFNDVKNELVTYQLVQPISVKKDMLTHLDMHHFINRRENFMIPLVERNVIPTTLWLPFVGEFIYFPEWLVVNIKFFLFNIPYLQLSDCDPQKLRDPEYTREVVANFRKCARYYGLLHIVGVAPILLYKVFVGVGDNLQKFRNDPGASAVRTFSPYARYYLRHYNELDHELDERLKKSHKPTSEYLKCFTMPIVTAVAVPVRSICGLLLAFQVMILVVDGDGDLFNVHPMMQVMAALTVIFLVAQGLIPGDDFVCEPESYRKTMLDHMHYMPTSWHGKMHTNHVQQSVGKLFVLKIVLIIQEMLSPLITWVIFSWTIANKAEVFVDFFQKYTVQVEGIGYVCSFAQMDITRHGTTSLQPNAESTSRKDPYNNTPDNGKTELSLVNFKTNNPKWSPPNQEAVEFLASLPPLESNANDTLTTNTLAQPPIHPDFISGYGPGAFDSPKPDGEVKVQAWHNTSMSAQYFHDMKLKRDERRDQGEINQPVCRQRAASVDRTDCREATNSNCRTNTNNDYRAIAMDRDEDYQADEECQDYRGHPSGHQTEFHEDFPTASDRHNLRTDPLASSPNYQLQRQPQYQQHLYQPLQHHDQPYAQHHNAPQHEHPYHPQRKDLLHHFDLDHSTASTSMRRTPSPPLFLRSRDQDGLESALESTSDSQLTSRLDSLIASPLESQTESPLSSQQESIHLENSIVESPHPRENSPTVHLLDSHPDVDPPLVASPLRRQPEDLNATFRQTSTPRVRESPALQEQVLSPDSQPSAEEPSSNGQQHTS